MSRFILIHHHIFKNAGTSFNHALKQSFGEHFLEFDLPNGQPITENILDKFIIKNPQALAVSGHHICLSIPQKQNYQTISTILLRKPLTRIRSIYNFERQQDAQTSGAIKAKELSFSEFVKWRLKTSPLVFCNYQTYYCSMTGNPKPAHNINENDLELAMVNLQNCVVVGTVERYQESLQIANERLQEFFPKINLGYTRKNITSPSCLSDEEIKANLIKDLGQSLVNQLEENNYLDEKLYQFADTSINNHWQSRGTKMLLK